MRIMVRDELYSITSELMVEKWNVLQILYILVRSLIQAGNCIQEIQKRMRHDCQGKNQKRFWEVKMCQLETKAKIIHIPSYSGGCKGWSMKKVDTWYVLLQEKYRDITQSHWLLCRKNECVGFRLNRAWNFIRS